LSGCDPDEVLACLVLVAAATATSQAQRSQAGRKLTASAPAAAGGRRANARDAVRRARDARHAVGLAVGRAAAVDRLDRVVAEVTVGGGSVGNTLLLEAVGDLTGIGWGDYWVVDLARDGRYAIVSEASCEYLWVLARQPALTPQDDTAIHAELRARSASTWPACKPIPKASTRSGAKIAVYSSSPPVAGSCCTHSSSAPRPRRRAALSSTPTATASKPSFARGRE
jgi:hypothetical protein